MSFMMNHMQNGGKHEEILGYMLLILMLVLMLMIPYDMFCKKIMKSQGCKRIGKLNNLKIKLRQLTSTQVSSKARHDKSELTTWS